MTEHTITDDHTRSPRALFAQRFAELYEAAGNPTLRRVATAADTRMRAAQGNRPGGASAQRISDWKAGRNVPARFESLLPVVLTLVELARKRGAPLPHTLADPKQWQRLWHTATTWNPEDDTESACPYLGLTSYRPENHALFFGRTRSTTELITLLREATGMVAVIGASGAGKSSLLAAGLVPALPDWEITTFAPGAHPLTALHTAIGSRSTTAESAPDVLSQPDRAERTACDGRTGPDDRTAHDVAADDTSRGAGIADGLAPRVEGRRRLLIIDQFEELFTTCADEHEREEFLATLDRCATRADDPLAVVIALRADFYAHCLNYLVLQRTLEQRSYLLGPMRMDELAQAISGPARAAGLELEPGLEELVITELCGAGDHYGRRSYDPGALPLLSHVMSATWQHREGRRLTTAGYRKAGGVVGSVAETAEYAWNELTSAQQQAAEVILLALVTVGQDARDTRRTGQRHELLGRVEDHQDADAALELLSRTRLITLDADTVSLTHEVVLTAWPRLRHWIDEDRVGYLVRQRLEADAAEWAAQERDHSLLYRGTRLRNAREHARSTPVGPLAAAFLTASTTTRNRTRRRSSRAKAMLALLGVALLVLGFAVYSQVRITDRQRDDSRFNAVLAEADGLAHSNPSLAAQLYLIAHQLRPENSDANTRVLRTQNMPLAAANPAHSNGIRAVARGKGDLLASLSWDRELKLWDVAEALHPRQLGDPINGITKVAINATGDLMATSSGGGDIRIWDLRVPATPRQLTSLPHTVGDEALDLQFAGDGRTLIVVEIDRLIPWSLSDLGAPRALAPYVIYPGMSTRKMTTPPHLAVSSDGRILAISRDAGLDSDHVTESVQLLRLASDGSVITVLMDRLETPEVSINSIAFSPDGRTLAVGAANETARSLNGTTMVQLWEISDPVHAHRSGTVSEAGFVQGSLAFSPDSRILAAATADGIGMWNVTEPSSPGLMTNELSSGKTLCRIGRATTPCGGSMGDFVFTSDGRALLEGSAGGEIRTWSPPPSVLTKQAGYVTAPTFDATGNRMVTVSGDGRIAVWDIRNRLSPNRTGEFRLPPLFYGAHLSPDGNTLVITTTDTDEWPGSMTTLALDLSDPARIHLLADWTPSLGPAQSLSFSSDWRILATLDIDRTIRLWDLSDRTRPRPIGPGFAKEPTTLTQVAFGKDDTTLLVQQRNWGGDESGSLVVSRWDISDTTNPRRTGEVLRNDSDEAGQMNAYFTPDRRTMVIANYGNIEVWDISDPGKTEALGSPITAHDLSVGSVDFSQDGKTMLTSSVDGAVQLWDFSDRTRPERKDGAIQETGSASSTVLFHPSGRLLAGGGSDGMIRLWDLDEQHAIDRICAITGKMWTPELWRRYLPEVDYRPPCE
ncbi:nSTAND1 domain-containing NTPase [Nocardia jejuensis]|uniref:nSTAND1 domain-containing NTPase n=1 Tax=Nocardia jejuensis TaxID=328049 RepID=UPI000829B21F|nr:hypothetical protein [Nocardia jejuensis]